MHDALEAYLLASGPSVNQEDVGRIVCDLFAKKRESVQGRIREIIAKIEEDASAGSLPSLEVTQWTGHEEPSHSNRVAIFTPMPVAGVTKWRTRVAIAAVATILGVAAFVLARSRTAPVVIVQQGSGQRRPLAPPPVAGPVPTEPAAATPDPSAWSAADAAQVLPDRAAGGPAVLRTHGAPGAAQPAPLAPPALPAWRRRRSGRRRRLPRQARRYPRTRPRGEDSRTDLLSSTWRMPTPMKRSHAILCTWSLTMAVAVAATQLARADDVSPEARAHFKTGVAYLEDPEGQRFEDAYAEFRKAYELSHSAKILGNLGLCAMKLERDGEAIDDYTKYLTEVVDIEANERARRSRVTWAR